MRAAVRALVRLRLLVPLAWVAGALVMATHLQTFTQERQSTVGGLVPTNGAAAAVERRSFREFGTPLLSRVAVVQRDPHGLSRRAVRGAAALALRIDRRRAPLLRHIAFALPIENRTSALPGRERRTTIVTYLYYAAGVGSGARLALADTYASRLRDQAGSVVGVTGTLPARDAELSAINGALPLIEGATVGVIALILLLVFRGIGPPLVTFASAGIAYTIAVRCITLVAHALSVDVPREVEPVLVALILGLTTDYTVFFFSGVKQRLRAGEAPTPALARTARAYIPMIVTAGLIVALGSASLLVGRLALFRAFGPGMAISALVTLAVAVTFTPAMLAIFGRALFWPGLRGAAPVAAQEERQPGRLRLLVSGRGAAAALALVAAGALAYGALHARDTALGLPLVSGLGRDTEPRRAYDAASAGFTPGVVSPTELLVEGAGVAAARPRLARLQRELDRFEGVAGVVGPAEQPRDVRQPVFVSRRADAARYVLFFDSDPLGTHALHRLRELRSALPRLLATAGLPHARAALAGDTALVEEAVSATKGDIFRVGALLLLINLALLALLLRAVLAPLYLLLASALGLAATLGATSWFFERVLGYSDLAYYVPFAAAVLLLSLGSDYNIFITGQIWRAAERRSLRSAVATATPRASGTIAVAGITLAASFALLALVPTRPLRQFAFVMAAGILIDSFVVRSVLVPSLISAAGPLSWWPRRPPRRSERTAQPEVVEYDGAAEAVAGYRVEALDGAVGRIDRPSADGGRLVVRLGPWPRGRKVVLAPEVVERVDSEYGTVYVNCSKAEIESAPEPCPEGRAVPPAAGRALLGEKRSDG